MENKPLPPSTIAEALNWARQHIALVDARLLLRHILNCTQAHLVTWSEEKLSEKNQKDFCTLVKRRYHGEPVAYLIGKREFYGRIFSVTPAVLIPRPDTERLIEVVQMQTLPPNPRILDLGTGSGIIAITLALEYPNAVITAVDYSEAALALARANAAQLDASVSFLQSDWFSALPQKRFDLIVANPPYIPEADPHLKQGDLRFEPISALSAGANGLNDLNAIIQTAPLHLNIGGFLFIEHGYNQASAVRALLTTVGFNAVASWKDLDGIERVSGGCWPSTHNRHC